MNALGHGVLALSLQLLLLCSGQAQQTSYEIGTGIADCTGPAAGVNMMGYAKPEQVTSGIHQRQFSRAFIVGSGAKRVVFVSVDAGMVSQLVKAEVITQLKVKFGHLYSDENVCLSGTHTHSGTAGFHQYVLFEITSLGFIKEAFNAMVDGIVLSIERAHASMQPGRILMNKGELLDSNINRSPTAYANNPKSERSKYAYNVDKDMVLLKFESETGKQLGSLNWFSVHGTSMNNTNTLISGDNKGYASYLFERQMNASRQQGSFVAAFAQTNEGDVSPNTKGPHCIDTGLPCDAISSTCNGNVEKCVASGPGRDMVESTKIIGQHQYEKARELWSSATTRLDGPVDFRLKYVDMTKQQVKLADGSKAFTCKPAMGFSFAAGTTDGPGAFSFKQGDKHGNAFWDLIRDLIKKPSKSLEKCHYPKPILLPTGEINLPYKWQPDTVDTQIFRIGQLVIVAVPGEFSTMSGRRLRQAVRESLIAGGIPPGSEVVIAGLSNSYADYITTFEEYQVQRYEGASTIHGPHTLQAYIQQFKQLAFSIAKGTPVSKGLPPPNLRNKQVTLLPPVVYDTVPPFSHFGDVTKHPKEEYNPVSTAAASFRSGHPRNNQQLGSTFMTVDLKQGNGTWRTIATDNDWETRFRWKRTNELLGFSEVTVEWDIPANQRAGTYRLTHMGHYKAFWGGKIKSYSGVSKEFQVHSRTIQPKRGVWHHVRRLFSRS